MNHLLLDFGSTSVKYALYDDVEDVFLQRGGLAFPDQTIGTEPLLYEIDPAPIADLLYSLTETFRGKASAIHLSVQMHGYLLADKARKLLTGYISWRDRRSLLPYGETNCFRLFREEHPALPERDAGTAYKPNSPLCSVFAIEKHNPALFAETDEFFTLGSYLTFLLTGENTTHITDGAATGFYQTTSGKKSEGFPFSFRIPKAVCDYRSVGHYDGFAVYPAVGDHQASFLGSGIAGHENYLLNLGTAAQLSTLSREPLYGEFERRPYFDGSALLTVSGLVGGKEIYDSGETLPEHLTNNYKEAMNRLPERKGILVTGGAAAHNRELIAEVCKRLSLPFQIEIEKDALCGLVRLIQTVFL